ncbi:MAG: WG repeat-containing protein, partial [bacterium]|nr:WG repeat-containing protein [bacterium]
RSVHVAAVRLNEDGTEGDGAEVWYDREHGVLQRMTFRDREIVVRDDGRSRLEYTAGADFALKTESTDAMGLVRKVMNVARITEGYERAPSEDRDVEGVPCQCYMDMAPDGSNAQMAWVDAEGRLRLHQERTRTADGTYVPDDLVTITYNEPHDPTVFEVALGPNVKIIDQSQSDTVLAHRFNPDDALAAREVLGLVFAVHELEVLDDGRLYLVSSLRPSKETVDTLGPIHWNRREGHRTYDSYGRFALTSWWDRMPDGTLIEEPMHTKTLMELAHNGVTVRWYLLQPAKTWPGMYDRLRISGYVHTDGKLQKMHEDAGEEWFDKYRPLLEVELPKERINLDSALQLAWRDACELAPIAYEMHAFAGNRALTEEERQMHLNTGSSPEEVAKLNVVNRERVTDLSEETFLSAVGNNLAELPPIPDTVLAAMAEGPTVLADARSYNSSWGLADVLAGSQMGYIDKTGAVVIEPQFGEAEPFSEGMAAVRDIPAKGQAWALAPWGYVNAAGDLIIPFQFKEACPFSEGRAAVLTETGWGHIDKNGSPITPPGYGSLGSFHDGLAPFTVADKSGFVDRDGAVAIEPRFESAWEFSEGLAIVKIEGTFGFIDTSGMIVIEPRYEQARQCKQGRIPVCTDGKWGLIDHTGATVLEPTFDAICEFSQGRACVMSESLYGFVDLNGNVVIPVVYEDTTLYFREGLVSVSRGGPENRFMINLQGNVVPDIRAQQFADGLSPVQDFSKNAEHGYWGYVDHTGRFVIEPTFEYARAFSEGRAAFAINVNWKALNNSSW